MGTGPGEKGRKRHREKASRSDAAVEEGVRAVSDKETRIAEDKGRKGIDIDPNVSWKKGPSF